MQTARKLREMSFTHVYRGKPGKWLLVTQMVVHNAVLGMGTPKPREKKNLLSGLLRTCPFKI